MKKSSEILKMDQYGSRWEIQKLTLEKEFACVGILVTILACILDFANVFTRYDTINKPTSIIMLLAMTLATVIVLDVPMYVAGSVMKSYMQKLRPKNETFIIVAGAVFAFFVVAILNLVLGLECGGFMLEDPAVKAGGVFDEVEPTNSVVIGSWVLGLLPILTSIASFVVGLYCSNPRLHNVNQLKKALNQIYSFVMLAKKAQAEAFFHDPKLAFFSKEFFGLIKELSLVAPSDRKAVEGIIKRFEELADTVDDAYINSSMLKNIIAKHKAAVGVVYAQEGVRQVAACEALYKKLNTPDDISVVSEEAIKVSKEYDWNEPVEYNILGDLSPTVKKNKGV